MARTSVRERLLRRLLLRFLRKQGPSTWGVAEGHPRDEGDDGTAGVREPRRPVHPPSDLAAEEPVP